MNSRKTVRWGVLGTANIARVAMNPAIQAAKNSELLAVASLDPARAAAFAARANIPRHYGSYQALLDDPEIDAVYIPLPNSMHREWTVRAAERGKHVLCEKPLAVSVSECLDMTCAAAANGVQLMEAFMYRFHPRTEEVLARVRHGEIGSVRVVRSAFTFRVTRPENIRLSSVLGGGSLMDVGSYCVNISRAVLRAEPEHVQAWATWGSSGVDTELSGMLRFADGAVALFDSALSLERREHYEIAGTLGSLSVDAAFLPPKGDCTVIERGAAGETRHATKGVDQYQLMVEHFVAAVRGDVELRYPALDAARNMAVIEALYQSARKGGQAEPVARVA